MKNRGLVTAEKSSGWSSRWLRGGASQQEFHRREQLRAAAAAGSTPARRILLVYPEFPRTTYWSFTYALSFIGKDSSMPPLGLITVAAMLPKEFEVRLVDMNLDPLRDEDLLWADYVLTSTMVVQAESLTEVIRRANALQRPVIAGGPHPTSYHQEIAGVAAVVTGEAEVVIAELSRDLASGQLKPHYAAGERPELAQTPVPRFELLQHARYGTMAIQFSRGCPFKCEFCDIWKMYGNRPRLKEFERIFQELDALHEMGWRGSVFFVDDNFIGNKPQVKAFLPLLVEWQTRHGYPFSFFTEASVNVADDPTLLELMRNAGFNLLFLGIETPIEASLKETHKPQNLRGALLESVRKIQSYGIEVTAGFIIGFDSDPLEVFEAQISFIQNSAIPLAMVGMLTALKGTDLYDRLKRENRLLAESKGNNTHQFEPNFVPKMELKVLVEGYKRVLSTIYDRNLKNYFARCSLLFEQLGENALFSRKINWFEFAAFLRSMRRQFLRRYGAQYARFLLRTLWRHPSKFAEAVRLGIMGHHFREITWGALEAYELNCYLQAKLEYLHSLLEGPQKLQHRVDEWYAVRKKVLADASKRLHGLSREYQELVRDSYEEFVMRIDALHASVTA